MTRPTTVPTFGQGNYAAGPVWGGTPRSVVPSVPYVTPGTLFPAQNANYLYGDLYTRIDTLQTWTAQMIALNWSAPVSTNTTNINAGQWLTGAHQWLGIGTNNNDTAVLSADYGKTWTAITFTGGKNVHIFDMAGDETGLILEGITKTSGGATWVYTSVDNGTTWTYQDIFGSVGTISSGQVGFDFTYPGFFFVMLKTGVGIKAGYILSSAPTVFGLTATSPASWAGATTAAPKMCVNQDFAGTWLVCHFTNATSTFYVAKSSDGGAHWSEVTLTSGLTLAGMTRPVYDDQNGIFVLCVNSTGPVTEFWTSPDGTTWTKKPYTYATDITSITCIGSLWIVRGSASGKVCYSYDQGATFFTDTGATADSSADAALWASPTQFMAFKSGAVQASFKMGDGDFVTP